MSLKKELIKQIKGMNGGIFTYNDFKQFCAIRGYKESNGERRLRPSEQDEVEAVLSPKKAIIGYRYKQPQLRLF